MTGFKHTVASFVFVFVCACCLWLCVSVSHYILAKRCVCTGLTVVRVRFQMKRLYYQKKYKRYQLQVFVLK